MQDEDILLVKEEERANTCSWTAFMPVTRNGTGPAVTEVGTTRDATPTSKAFASWPELIPCVHEVFLAKSGFRLPFNCKNKRQMRDGHTSKLLIPSAKAMGRWSFLTATHPSARQESSLCTRGMHFSVGAGVQPAIWGRTALAREGHTGSHAAGARTGRGFGGRPGSRPCPAPKS